MVGLVGLVEWLDCSDWLDWFMITTKDYRLS
jgi:hypothetical protein